MKQWINKKEITYLRHIELLPKGYDPNAHPTYSLIYLNTCLEIDKKEFDSLLNIFPKTIITSKPPQPSVIGYPNGSTIHYYINFKKITAIIPEYDCFIIMFDNTSRLYVYNNLNKYQDLMFSLSLDSFSLLGKDLNENK